MTQVALRHLQGWPTIASPGLDVEQALQRQLALDMGAKD
jgi:hypothetical protein